MLKIKTYSGSNWKVGRAGENLAVEILEKYGWKILERNWRSNKGEIDIVASHGGVLAFYEVKTRTSKYCGAGAEHIGKQKIKRMRSLSSSWLAEFSKFEYSFISLRVIEIAVTDYQLPKVRFMEVGA
ncbi:YraN family protein [Actinomycetaceae bacterium TAE3-ERU4]|nr:YraN family protein [Actinomycetaceae bacterium TAE3-ERU4]